MFTLFSISNEGSANGSKSSTMTMHKAFALRSSGGLTSTPDWHTNVRHSSLSFALERRTTRKRMCTSQPPRIFPAVHQRRRYWIRLCRKSRRESLPHLSSIPTVKHHAYRQAFEARQCLVVDVEAKTGKKSLPSGTNANVYIRIVDLDGNKSETMQLKRSTGHRVSFARGQTDEFDIGIF